MSGLPEGWILTSLGEVGQWSSGGTPSRKNPEYFGSGIPWIKSGDLPDGPILRTEEQITELGLKNSSAKLMQAGTISIAMYGATIGKLGLLTFPATTNQACANIIPQSQLIDRDYLFFYLLSERQALIDKGQGGAQPNISQEVIKAHPIVIAPLAEQRRIVAKLKPLLGNVDAYQQRLVKIPVVLKRFRQAVLAAACSGRLTADWRADNDKENDLPTGWRWITLENLLPRGGIFDGPFGSNLKTSDYTHSGVRVIRLENIGHLHFINEKETLISQEKYEELVKHTVGQGDIIFSSFIADEIRVCVLPAFKTKAIAKADCFCLRPKDNLVDRAYLAFQLASRESYKALVEEVHGATRPRINTTQLRNLKIRLCPLDEQQEIVRRVEPLFKLADQIEARYQKAKPLVDKLPQSILAKAFRGELVPTEAELARREGRDYEQASVLIERIRSERAEHAQGRKEKPGRSRSQQAQGKERAPTLPQKPHS